MLIGEILREAREEQGLSLDNIQEMTKIQKRYLVAIEQDEFHALPGRFYARAFIKEYAQAVDLDPAVILADFDDESIKVEQEETVQYTRMNRTKQAREKGSYFLSFLPTIIVIILIIGIIFVAFTLLQKSSTNNDGEVDAPQENDEIIRNKDQDPKSDNAEDKEEETTKDEEDTPTEEEEEDNKEEAGTFEIVETGEGNSPLSTMDFYNESSEVILQLKASADTYVQLLDENEQLIYEETMTEGMEVEEFDVSGQEKVYFNIGNAAGLTVMINDVELEYPVDKNERVHQKLWINFKE